MHESRVNPGQKREIAGHHQVLDVVGAGEVSGLGIGFGHPAQDLRRQRGACFGVIEAGVGDGEALRAQMRREFSHGGQDEGDLLLMVRHMGAFCRDLCHHDDIPGGVGRAQGSEIVRQLVTQLKNQPHLWTFALQMPGTARAHRLDRRLVAALAGRSAAATFGARVGGRGPVLNIVWFKRDLRVHDHAPLSRAAAMGSVLPIYIAEPGLWAGPDASARQWDFVAECLASLQSDLGRPGLPLRILLGEAVPVLQALSQQHRIAALWSHEETGNAWTFARDRRVAAWAKAAGIAWHERRQTGVIRRLKSRDGWATVWDAEMAKPVTPPALALTGPAGDWPMRVPVARDLGLADDPCPQRQAGGRAAGRQDGRAAGRWHWTPSTAF